MQDDTKTDIVPPLKNSTKHLKITKDEENMLKNLAEELKSREESGQGTDYKDDNEDFKISDKEEDVMRKLNDDVQSELNSLSNGGLEFDWENEEKRPKICEALDRGDTVLDLLAKSDCNEASKYCIYLKRGKRDVKSTCFNTDGPVGEEEKEYCQKLEDFFELRKKHCGVDTKEKYYSK